MGGGLEPWKTDAGSVVSSERQVWPGRGNRSLYIRRVNSNGYAPAAALIVLFDHTAGFRPATGSGTRRAPGRRRFPYTSVASRIARSAASRRPRPPRGLSRVPWARGRPSGVAGPGPRVAHNRVTPERARQVGSKNQSLLTTVTLIGYASPGRSSTASLRASTDQGSQYSNTQCSQHTSSQARMAPERYVWCSRA